MVGILDGVPVILDSIIKIIFLLAFIPFSKYLSKSSLEESDVIIVLPLKWSSLLNSESHLINHNHKGWTQLNISLLIWCIIWLHFSTDISPFTLVQLTEIILSIQYCFLSTQHKFSEGNDSIQHLEWIWSRIDYTDGDYFDDGTKYIPCAE